MPVPHGIKSNIVQKKHTKLLWQRGHLIGQGSYGRVYMALNIQACESARAGCMLAVKEFDINRHSFDSASKTKLQSKFAEIEKEMDYLKKLQHPNVVAFLGSGSGNTLNGGDCFHILMEFVPGLSLEQVIKNLEAPLNSKIAQLYIFQIVTALSYIHSLRIIHRDLKPANVLISHDGIAKLADFGSAKEIISSFDAERQPSIGYHFTPLYTSHEVLNGKYTSKVDIWSLGCIMIELGSGSPPWKEKKWQQDYAAIFCIAKGEETPLLPTKVHSEMYSMMKKCIQLDSKNRWSADQLLQHPFFKVDFDKINQENNIVLNLTGTGGSFKATSLVNDADAADDGIFWDSLEVNRALQKAPLYFACTDEQLYTISGEYDDGNRGVGSDMATERYTNSTLNLQYSPRQLSAEQVNHTAQMDITMEMNDDGNLLDEHRNVSSTSSVLSLVKSSPEPQTRPSLSRLSDAIRGPNHLHPKQHQNSNPNNNHQLLRFSI